MAIDYEKVKNMKPMKYYEGDLTKDKAKDMIENKDNNYIALEKKDGEWARAIISEKDVLIQSRSVSKVTGTYGDKTELVPHIVEELRKLPAGTVVLGELAFPEESKTSRDVGSILRCKAPKAIERQKKNKLNFYIFDVLAYNGTDISEKPFYQRFAVNPGFVYKFKYIGYPLSVDEKSNKDFMEFAEFIWERDGEGIIIMDKNAPYRPGKRKAWESLKIKKKLGDLEVKVIGTLEPKKHYEGKELDTWPYFIEENNNKIPVTKPYYNGWKNGIIIEYEGREVKVSSGLSDQDREWLATHAAEEAIKNGTLYAVVTGMALTESSIRHPVLIKLRTDVI